MRGEDEEASMGIGADGRQTGSVCDDAPVKKIQSLQTKETILHVRPRLRPARRATRPVLLLGGANKRRAGVTGQQHHHHPRGEDRPDVGGDGNKSPQRGIKHGACRNFVRGNGNRDGRRGGAPEAVRNISGAWDCIYLPRTVPPGPCVINEEALRHKIVRDETGRPQLKSNARADGEHAAYRG